MQTVDTHRMWDRVLASSVMMRCSLCFEPFGTLRSVFWAALRAEASPQDEVRCQDVNGVRVAAFLPRAEKLWCLGCPD